MSSIVFFRPSKELFESTKKIIEKYNKIYKLKLKAESVKNAMEYGRLIDQGKQIKTIFIEVKIDLVEVNALYSIYRTRKDRPLINTYFLNYEILSKKLPKVELKIFFKHFTPINIVEYINEYIITTTTKIDKRIIKEVLISILDIIKQNTGESLKPSEIDETRNPSSTQELSSVISYMGSGLMGTLVISASQDSVNTFATKMLYCEREAVTTEMRTDVLNELSNQILGIFRIKLAKIGYKIATSMQMVVSSGKDHFSHNKTRGHYYTLHFRHGDNDFTVSFTYRVYRFNKEENETEATTKGANCLDVRMLNTVINSVSEEFVIGNHHAVKTGIARLISSSYHADSIHIINCSGPQGGLLFGLDIPTKTMNYFIHQMLGVFDEDITPKMVNDLSSELIKHMVRVIKAASEKFGYNFQTIFHGSFCGEKEKVGYLLRNQGLYTRIEYQVNKKPFWLCFGMDSSFAGDFFNIWSYLEQDKDF